MGSFVSVEKGVRQRKAAAASPAAEGCLVDRPTFHLMADGWINDPNGPIKVNGTYHLFYQHVPNKSEWSFGIVWAHASSTDLVHWKKHPHAIEPTEGFLDADGCFSGCCVEGEDGTVNMLYTGVRLRSKLSPGELPPEGHDLHLEFIESQLSAQAALGDEELVKWIKNPTAAIPYPPKNLPLTGWRDPFVLPKRPTDDSWTMLMGSGIKDQGGAVMVYKSNSLTAGWYFDGFLASGDGENGAMWECPLLAKLPYKTVNVPPKAVFPKSTSVGASLYELAGSEMQVIELPKSRSSRSRSVDMTAMMTAEKISFQIPTALEHVEEAGLQYFFCVSPDSPENPVLYWMGDYRDGKFIIEEAKGPYQIDLGDTTYAPNMIEDEEGNQMLWIWSRDHEQEKLPFMESQGYSGCLSTPRKLSVHNGKLFQEPAEEIDGMRSSVNWHAKDLCIQPGAPQSVNAVGGQAIDMKLTFEKGSSAAVGLLLHPLKNGYESAAIIYDWKTATLEVIVNPEGFFPCAKGSRSTGGVIGLEQQKELTLRILIDFSSIEIFTHTGQVLTTRVYRGKSNPNCNPGIDLVVFGGASKLSHGSIYEVNSIWKNPKNQAFAANAAESQTSSTQVSAVSSHISVDHAWFSYWSGAYPRIAIC